MDAGVKTVYLSFSCVYQIVSLIEIYMFIYGGCYDFISVLRFSFIFINMQMGEFQICPCMDLDNILYVEYLRYINYKNEIILFLECC